MSTAVLNELLDIGLRYAPEYQGGLSNHLPMALGALHGLGADGDRLREFFERYTPRLALAPPRGRALADWRTALGRMDAWADLFETFRVRIEHEGAPALLRETLPVLMEGVGAAAFHGPIRTAYGIENGHPGDTAAGLAYWAARHLPLPAPEVAAAHAAPAGWLAALAASLADTAFEGGLIFERMRAVGRSAAFARHAGALAVDAHTLQALADFAASAYAATRNFTVLHLVTSAHAMRLLLAQLAERDAALRAYARAFAAGVIASGIRLDAPLLPPPALDWTEVVRRARRADDDHVIKLAYSCRAEALAYGDGARLHAAALAVAAG